MKTSNIPNKISLIYIILAALYTVADMAAFPKKPFLFFVIWIITTLMILFQIVLVKKYIPNDEKVKFLSIPCIAAGNAGMVVQIVWTYYANRFILVSALNRYVIVIQAVIVAAFAVAVIAASAVKEQAQNLEAENKAAALEVKKWAVSAQEITDNLKGTEYYEKSKKLLDDVKYSSPKSHPETFQEEQEIEDRLRMLVSVCTDKSADKSDLDSQMDELISVIRKRNNTIKAIR